MPGMDENELRIWPRHLYSVPYLGRSGFCAQGSRQWFSAHGLSWADFVANGISAAVLAATGDPMAIHLIEHTKVVEAGHGR